MKVHIKRIDKTLPFPAYQTKGSVCFDLIARETVEIIPQQVRLIPCNIIIQVPKGYMLLLAQRSSTALKKGLLIPNGIGIIDQDYCGPADEVKYQAFNFSDKTVIVEKGERLVQGCIVPIERVELVEVAHTAKKSRGGFGSTG